MPPIGLFTVIYLRLFYIIRQLMEAYFRPTKINKGGALYKPTPERRDCSLEKLLEHISKNILIPFFVF